MPLITITGTVSTIQSGQYPNVKLWETYDFRGTERHRLWTAWSDVTLNLAEGDTITVTGDLGTKVGTYTKPGDEPKSVVEHSINNTTLDAHSPKAATAPQKQATTPATGYNPVADLSTPF